MIISCVAVKGGCGKTTLSAHLAGYLARSGKLVAALDGDPQKGLTLWLKEALPDVEVIRAETPDEILESLPELQERAEYVIADGMAGAMEGSRALMLRSDLVVIPMTPSILDLRALQDTARLVQQARSIRGGLPRAVVVLNRWQPNTIISKEIAEAVPDIGLPVVKAIIKQRTAIADSCGQARFTWELGRNAADAAQEIEFALEEVLSHDSTSETERSPEGGGESISGGREAERAGSPGPGSGGAP